VANRLAPKIVLQNTRTTCWAAALESWLDTADKTRFQTQDQLVHQVSGDSSFKGGFKIEPGFRNVAASKGMTTKFVRLDDFTPWSLSKKLEVSVLFVGFEMEKYSIWWHAVVLYAIESPNKGSTRFYVMDPGADPRPPKTQGLDTWDLSAFFVAGPERLVLVGWKENGPGKLL
jgi:hypothetical protein